MKHIEVVAAVIKFENKILCVQRNKNKYEYISYKYEFPGGKVEENETNEIALKREIQEELNLDIKIESPFMVVEHSYPDFDITMNTYLCSCTTKDIKLNEHIDLKWLSINELGSLDWAEADLPIVEKLINY
ncbi:MAG: (deoxy)nucleoside triphosphate pyrophosphohydrolase [Flavobacteriales bacterium]|nr:(deoxy)nucleoside triphosphate pyrophosphohydrolase [Flavobacteriales bacterium]